MFIKQADFFLAFTKTFQEQLIGTLFDLNMVRGKRLSTSHWTTACDTENFVQDLFGGIDEYQGRKITEISAKEFPQLVEVFNCLSKFQENNSSMIFQAHWNKEKCLGLNTRRR